MPTSVNEQDFPVAEGLALVQPPCPGPARSPRRVAAAKAGRKTAPAPAARLEVVGEVDSGGHHYLIVKARGGKPRAQPACKPVEPLPELARLLTERELQIAALVSRGGLNKQIAAALRISEYTVSTHLRRIFSKLNINKRSALAYLYAVSAKEGRDTPA